MVAYAPAASPRNLMLISKKNEQSHHKLKKKTISAKRYFYTPPE